MSTLTEPLQSRLDQLLTDPAIHDASAPGHADKRAEVQNLAQLQRLTQSEAYWNPSHPEHDVVKAQVRAFHEIEFTGQSATRRPNAVVIDSGNLNAPVRRQLG